MQANQGTTQRVRPPVVVHVPEPVGYQPRHAGRSALPAPPAWHVVAGLALGALAVVAAYLLLTAGLA